jgi:pimeloyl-ACP methyl ester carboxylesterase
MNKASTARKSVETARHRTVWMEQGPASGPLMIFLHGWPELGLVWRAQLDHFAGLGWRCVAPDMRGYGGSSVPSATASYAVSELVGDMIELHDALGGAPAVWVGHDWGSTVAWSMASHHGTRCCGVINLCVPYFTRGMALPTLLPLVDRSLYPMEQFPVGQWDYWLFYGEHFAQAAQDFEANVEATLALLYRRAVHDGQPKPAFSASIRANQGWFGVPRQAPRMPRDSSMLTQADFESLVSAFQSTGFLGANAWYMNDAANLAYAAQAPQFGRLTLPALFLHASRDQTCETVHSRLANPMREDCKDLTEVTIDCGHEVMLERPKELNEAMAVWLASKGLG